MEEGASEKAAGSFWKKELKRDSICSLEQNLAFASKKAIIHLSHWSEVTIIPSLF